MASEEPEWKKTAIPLDVHLAIVGHLVAGLPEADRARVFDEAMGLAHRMVLDGALGRRYTPDPRKSPCARKPLCGFADFAETTVLLGPVP